jgi:chromosome segregation ATPase
MAITDYRPTPMFWIALGGATLVLLVTIFFVKPAFTGYATYQAMQESGVPDDYATDMVKLQAAVETAQAAQAEAERAQAAAEAERDAALGEKTKAMSSLTQVQDQTEAQLTAAVEQAKQQQALVESMDEDRRATQELLERYENDVKEVESLREVAENAARRLCCIQRVENPDIDSYNIDDDRIICASGGENELSC